MIGKRSILVSGGEVNAFEFDAWNMSFRVLGGNGFFTAIKKLSGEWGPQGPIEHMILFNRHYRIAWTDSETGLIASSIILDFDALNQKETHA